MHETLVRTTGKAAIALPFLFCALAAQVQAKPPERIEFAPSSKWHVEWQEKTCSLKRQFGTPDDAMQLHVEKFGPQDGFQLIVAGHRLKIVQPGDSFTIHYGPNLYIHEFRNAMVSPVTGGMRAVFADSSLTGARPSDDKIAIKPAGLEASIKEISISRIRGKQLVLKTGSLAKPFAELDKCANQLIEEWGLVPAEQAKLQRPVTPKNFPGSWVTTRDYPTGALYKGSQAIVRFLLLVDAEGKATKCIVQKKNTGEGFSDPTCDLVMKRAQFDPAISAEGKPIASYYRNTVRWVVP